MSLKSTTAFPLDPDTSTTMHSSVLRFAAEAAERAEAAGAGGAAADGAGGAAAGGAATGGAGVAGAGIAGSGGAPGAGGAGAGGAGTAGPRFEGAEDVIEGESTSPENVQGDAYLSSPLDRLPSTGHGGGTRLARADQPLQAGYIDLKPWSAQARQDLPTETVRNARLSKNHHAQASLAGRSGHPHARGVLLALLAGQNPRA
jgi:hypothetical protein